MSAIDSTTWRKDSRPVGTGWDRRPKAQAPSSIIIHTTNGNRGTDFADEAAFLFYSNSVGAHYLVGKAGQIAMLLPPELRAWHAGVTKEEWINSRSIGIECHHAVGEEWTTAQRNALTRLVLKLMGDYRIKAGMIETHREVALPKGRKIDPSDWTDRSFYDWRASLDTPVMPPGTYPVDPDLVDEHQASGGLYNGRNFAPGYALTPMFTHEGQRYQIFERTGIRIKSNGAIEWLFTAEVEALKKIRGS